MMRRTLVLALAIVCGLGTIEAEAANPFSRLKFFSVRRGEQEVVGVGTIDTVDTPDYLIFFLVGTGPATLTVFDANPSGDTIAVNGTLNAVQPVVFSDSATSPAQVVETVLVPVFGILVVDVSYSSFLNPVPQEYVYRLKF